MVKRSSMASAVALVAVVVVLTGCDNLLSNPTGSEDVAVSIVSDGYNPPVDTVTVGTTVWWHNMDTGDHTVTSDTGAFYSATLHQNNRYPHTFAIPGTYPYHCNFDSSIHGTIVVVVSE